MSEQGRRDLPIRDDLRCLTAYGAPQLDVAVRLNTNESPHPPPPAVVAALRDALGTVAAGLNRYPDRDASALRADLAAYLGHGLDAAQVWAANGSNEVLQQLLQLFGGPGRTALGFEPGYAMHRLIARTTGTGWAAAGRRADFALPADHAVAAIAGHRPDVVLLCSPNNPTGTALDLDVIARAYEAAQQGGPSVVVVDEAYAEFSARPSALGLLPGRPLLVVTRTMSKAFALAGARVGYLAAAPEVVAALQLVRLPYHLSALTQTAARVALAFAGELLGAVEALKAQRDRLVVELRGLGLSVVDSDANFVLFGRFADQAAVWRALLDRGVLVRDVGLDGWLRVTAGTQPETDAFLAAMRDALQAAA